MIAETILEQLGGRRFILMTGARNFVYSETSLYFSIGKNMSESNFVQIEYNFDKDLYNMIFMRKYRNSDTKELERYEELYFDDLERFFTDYTGLRTTL
jgi:hypothetical protein